MESFIILDPHIDPIAMLEYIMDDNIGKSWLPVVLIKPTTKRIFKMVLGLFVIHVLYSEVLLFRYFALSKSNPLGNE